MQGKLSLFENDKGNNEKRPDFRGTGEIDGKPFKVAMWWSTAKNNGLKYLSGKIEDEDGPLNGESQKPRYGRPEGASCGTKQPAQPTARAASKVPSSGKTREQLQDMEVTANDVGPDDAPF